jgi:hypothetical protein
MSEYEMENFEESIREKIYSIRGFQVMLDSDLAELYGVETKYLNRVMKRNLLRFPPSYCFQISGDEIELIQNDIQTRNEPRNCLRCQIVTSKRGGRQYKPYAFTEQGVAMLSAVLRSDTAIEISIKIIDTFIQMRRFIQTNAQVFQRLGIKEF